MSNLIHEEDRTRRTVWISGLDDLVSPSLITAACLPFGDIVDVSLPLDNKTGKHRGFAFIEFEIGADAKECVDNLHGAELFGKSITARISKRSVTSDKGGAVWNAESWVNELGGEGDGNATTASTTTATNDDDQD
jgi:peptidyl-prolyl isomerase E (cyclophilin E)